MATTYLPGTQLMVPPSYPAAPTGQIVPSSPSFGPKPADVFSVRDVPKTALPSPSAPQVGGMKTANPFVKGLSSLVKGGIVTGLMTPNTMGDATLTGNNMGPLYGEPGQGKTFIEGVGWITDPSAQAVESAGMSRLGDEPIRFSQPTGPSSTPSISAEIGQTQSPEAGLMGEAGIPVPAVPTTTVGVDQGSVTAPSGMMEQTMGNVGNPDLLNVNELVSSGRADFETQSLADFTMGNTTEDRATEQFVDAQGRLRRRDKDTGNLTSQYTSYEEQARGREQRVDDDAANMGRSVSDRQRRGAGDISTADRSDMAKGNARGADPRDVARGQSVADELGVDPVTGKPVQTEGSEEDRLKLEKLRQEVESGNQPNATKFQKRRGELAEYLEAGVITESQYQDQLKRAALGNPPSGYNSWAEYEAATGTDVDGDGKIGEASSNGGNNDPLNLGL